MLYDITPLLDEKFITYERTNNPNEIKVQCISGLETAIP